VTWVEWFTIHCSFPALNAWASYELAYFLLQVFLWECKYDDPLNTNPNFCIIKVPVGSLAGEEILEAEGVEVVERVRLDLAPTEENLRYLQTKRDRMGHLLDLPESAI
jgi:hypothetical protein